MPLVEALLTTSSSLPFGTPGATSPGAEMLAGCSTASEGTLLPSGRDAAAVSSSAVSEAVALETARLAVQAPERSASGTRAVAFCQVVMRLLMVVDLSLLARRPVRSGLPG